MKVIFIISFIFVIQVPCLSQMPDWVFYKDREGNRYYLDKNGKIYTPHKPFYIYRPVSIDGLDFYLNHARELFPFHKKQSITILKSILALPVDNNRIVRAQVKAAEIINIYKNKEISRYNDISRYAAISYYTYNQKDYIINDFMRYSITLYYPSEVIRKRDKVLDAYDYTGLLIGLGENDPPFKKEVETFKPNIYKKKAPDNSRFSILLAIDSELFKGKNKDVNQYERYWRTLLGKDRFTRKLILYNDHKKIYFITNVEPAIVGYEALIVNGNYGHIVRIITPKKKGQQYNEKMLSMIKSFNIVQ